MKLEGKIAIVTGGSRGIGKAIATRFAAEGAAVALASRSLEGLEVVVKEITGKGGRAIAVPTDITKESQVRDMVAAVTRHFERIDILVNNAGAIGRPAEVIDTDLADWDIVLRLNLTGTMLCTREALRYMVPNRSGSIVNIGSFSGISGTPSRGAYCASKFGVVGLTETVAIEAGRFNIRANCISPAATGNEGFKKTALARATSLGMSADEWMERFTGSFSLSRIPESSEIAAAAVFLASEEASAITGVNLLVSCGYHITQPSEVR